MTSISMCAIMSRETDMKNLRPIIYQKLIFCEIYIDCKSRNKYCLKIEFSEINNETKKEKFEFSMEKEDLERFLKNIKIESKDLKKKYLEKVFQLEDITFQAKIDTNRNVVEMTLEIKSDNTNIKIIGFTELKKYILFFKDLEDLLKKENIHTNENILVIS